MIRVKICGITNTEDAGLASSLGAWALGFVFYKKSPRYISPSKARKIIEVLPPFVVPVGVFVNESEKTVKAIADSCGIKTLQFHGDETPQYCQKFGGYKVIKAFRVKSGFSAGGLSRYKVSAYLFDTYQKSSFGGSGKTFSWNIIKGKKFTHPVILSGGLKPGNVAEAIRTVRPYAVDVSSGVEASPGKKSEKLLKEFFRKVNNA